MTHQNGPRGRRPRVAGKALETLPGLPGRAGIGFSRRHNAACGTAGPVRVLAPPGRSPCATRGAACRRRRGCPPGYEGRAAARTPCGSGAPAPSPPPCWMPGGRGSPGGSAAWRPPATARCPGAAGIPRPWRGSWCARGTGPVRRAPGGTPPPRWRSGRGRTRRAGPRRGQPGPRPCVNCWGTARCWAPAPGWSCRAGGSSRQGQSRSCPGRTTGSSCPRRGRPA